MPSKAKNKKKDDGPTWDDEQAIRVLHHELETAATRAFRHPKIDPSAVYFSVLLGKKRSDSRAHERTRPKLSSMLIQPLFIQLAAKGGNRMFTRWKRSTLSFWSATSWICTED